MNMKDDESEKERWKVLKVYAQVNLSPNTLNTLFSHY
jgi:hypothetical protein